MSATRVIVNDLLQSAYEYERVAPPGEQFAPDFQPELSPAEMLRLGVFGGKYMNDCRDEFPDEWFQDAKLCATHHCAELNYFRVNASQTLGEWQRKGWIAPEDPRGWFQWYCRYYMGRRMDDDQRQIKRWRGIRRHVSQIQRNCEPFDHNCRRKQRQAVLHWAYDSRKF